MPTLEVEYFGPNFEEIRKLLDGVRKMNDDELWYYLTHLCRCSASCHRLVLGDGGLGCETTFVVEHFKGKGLV
jgi:hypothetical protein